MIKYLKRGKASQVKLEISAQVQATVTSIISDIEARGEAAVRDYSQKFDKWNPDAFRLSPEEIQRCIDSLSTQARHDIEFAQAQIRGFAQIQLNSLRDVEVETLPGVILGHRNLPIKSVGCYIPDRKYPLIASAHMSVLTANVAGVDRVIACAPPNEGKASPEIVSRRRARRRRPTRASRAWPHVACGVHHKQLKDC